MMQRRSMLRTGALTVAALAALSFGRRSDAARDGGMRLLCSGPAGSIPDLVARTVGEQLAAAQGQPVVVDNRPGAAGRLSVNALKAAPADGSTLLLAQGAVATVYPYLYARLGYDPDVDLQPVSLACEMSLCLAVGPAVPKEVATLAEFIEWARRHPAAANTGSPGIGTLPHLLEVMLFHEARVGWQHVAYSGGPPAVIDLLGGRIASLALPEGLLLQHHATGRIRILATSGPTRSAYLPDVPSFVELGHPDLLIKEWFAFFAPGGTSKHAIASLSAVMQGAIARPGLTAAFVQAGMTAVSCSPSSLSARITVEQQYWQPVLRAHAIHAE